jgi:hypothetical protein
MAIPKIIWESKKDSALQDKQRVESLKTRLNELILQDPKMAKKAALILESWLQQKSKK